MRRFFYVLFLHIGSVTPILASTNGLPYEVPTGVLSSLQNVTSGEQTISSYGSFLYDGVFNLKGLTGSVTGVPSFGGATTWNYDTKDRLTQEASARLGGYTQNFGYDSAGNPTTFKGVAQLFNSDNQRNAAGYVFDGNGNPTTYAGVALGFDAEDRLTGIGATWSASYRADGLRAKKVSGSTTTYFLYDGGIPVVEMDSAGTTTAINVYGPDGLVARKVGATSTYYTFDQQGNVSQRLNALEAVLSSSIYDAYGAESSSGSPSDPFAYNAQWGYYLDRETGLYACMFRYYDAGQGRWLNRDPNDYEGGINLYGYCGSSPVQFADTEGARKTWLYDLIERLSRTRLKRGLSYNPNTRYSKVYLDSINADVVKLYPLKDRSKAYARERTYVGNASEGELPLNNEPWSPNGRKRKAAVDAMKKSGVIAVFLLLLQNCVEAADPTPFGLAMDAGKLAGSVVQPWVDTNNSMNWGGGLRGGWQGWVEAGDEVIGP